MTTTTTTPPLYCTHTLANLPILPDYAALIEYCKLNPMTWVGRFQNGMAVMNDDGAFALLGTEALAEVKERTARPIEGARVDGRDVEGDGAEGVEADGAEAGDGAGRKGCGVAECSFKQED